MWGTLSYFKARGKAWMFHSLLKELPLAAANDSNFLQIAREAFQAAGCSRPLGRVTTLHHFPCRALHN
jgi:hypothetical protein